MATQPAVQPVGLARPMKIESKHKNVIVEMSEDGKTGNVVSAPGKGTRVLPLHYSLTGEVEPTLAPLSIDYSLDSNTSYRYDWVVGVAANWDYLKNIREKERAVCVQLLIDCGESGFNFSDSSPTLLGLTPSLNTSTWFEHHADVLREGVKAIAELAKPIVPVLPSVVQIASNFIPSNEGKIKNWFMYRFLDERKKCCAIEWNINKRVLVEYGPLLRGSVVLSFHGQSKIRDARVTLLLRPRLGFDQESILNYLPPLEQLEKESPVELSVRPQPHL